MTLEGEPTDEALMEAYASGDFACFDQLYRRHHRSLLTFLLHHTGSRELAADLFQETFLRLIRRRGHYRSHGSFRSWLFTIAHNLTIDDRRRRGLRESGPVEGGGAMTDDTEAEVPARERGTAPKDGATDPVASSQASEVRERIEEALLHIPEEQREVFLLRERGGLDFQGIAAATGCALPTVKSRMRYALANLRRQLAGDLASLAEGSHE